MLFASRSCPCGSIRLLGRPVTAHRGHPQPSPGSAILEHLGRSLPADAEQLVELVEFLLQECDEVDQVLDCHRPVMGAHRGFGRCEMSFVAGGDFVEGLMTDVTSSPWVRWLKFLPPSTRFIFPIVRLPMYMTGTELSAYSTSAAV